MTTISTSASSRGRLRRAWRRAHDPVEGVPQWARIAAYTIPWVVLPSSVWRIATFTFHIPLVEPLGNGSDGAGDIPSWLPLEVYVVLLSLFSELVAFTAVGLIARWGEVFPRWVPGLRGRRVPISLAVIPGLLGAAVLTVMWTWALAMGAAGRTVQGEPVPAENPLAEFDWHFVVAGVAYGPLMLWGPLLAAVTVAYYRRRRGASRRDCHVDPDG